MNQAARPSLHLATPLSRPAREMARWIVPLARFGYAAKGVVYVLIGALALVSAVESRRRDASSRGALRTILDSGEGPLLLGLVAVGLAGYALWRLVQAVKDTEGKGTSPKGLAVRGSYAVIAFVYAGLALSAVRMIEGRSGGGGGDAEAVGWTARLMQQPYGPWLVAAAGIGFVVFGVREAWRGYKAEFRKKLMTGRMGPTVRKLAIRSGQAGEMARGTVWVVVGIFLVLAAWRSDPGEARGLGGALREMGEQPFGAWLLGAVAMGLVAYGVFMLVQAVYRRMVVD